MIGFFRRWSMKVWSQDVNHSIKKTYVVTVSAQKTRAWLAKQIKTREAHAKWMQHHIASK